MSWEGETERNFFRERVRFLAHRAKDDQVESLRCERFFASRSRKEQEDIDFDESADYEIEYPANYDPTEFDYVPTRSSDSGLDTEYPVDYAPTEFDYTGYEGIDWFDPENPKWMTRTSEGIPMLLLDVEDDRPLHPRHWEMYDGVLREERL